MKERKRSGMKENNGTKRNEIGRKEMKWDEQKQSLMKENEVGQMKTKCDERKRSETNENEVG